VYSAKISSQDQGCDDMFQALPDMVQNLPSRNRMANFFIVVITPQLTFYEYSDGFMILLNSTVGKIFAVNIHTYMDNR